MAGSFRSLLWSNIVAAFAGSSTEALGAAMVNVSFFSTSLVCIRMLVTGSNCFISGLVLIMCFRTYISSTSVAQRWGYTCLFTPIPAAFTNLPTTRNAISGGNTLGPLICGFIVSNLSWRWHKWIAVILTALNFIAVVLFVPETRYTRSEGNQIDNNASSSAEDKLIPAGTISSRRASDDSVPQMPKKTFVQELSLWSGIPKTNLFKMFVRYDL
jgi:hypothetical protein